MSLCRIVLLALVCLTGLALVHVSQAQNSPEDYVCLTGLTQVNASEAQNSPEDYLNAHNAARAQVLGLSRDIAWNSTLAAYAQNYANQRIGDCALQHSGGPYGENIAVGSGYLTGTDAVKFWASGKEFYDYNTNTCAGGECRHYTQVVWSNSDRLGCARVQCNNGWFFITCNYDPPGNYVGQRPY